MGPREIICPEKHALDLKAEAAIRNEFSEDSSFSKSKFDKEFFELLEQFKKLYPQVYEKIEQKKKLNKSTSPIQSDDCIVVQHINLATA